MTKSMQIYLYANFPVFCELSDWCGVICYHFTDYSDTEISNFLKLFYVFNKVWLDCIFLITVHHI